MRNTKVLPVRSLGASAGEQLLGYLAENKLNICGEKEAYPHIL